MGNILLPQITLIIMVLLALLLVLFLLMRLWLVLSAALTLELKLENGPLWLSGKIIKQNPISDDGVEKVEVLLSYNQAKIKVWFNNNSTLLSTYPQGVKVKLLLTSFDRKSGYCYVGNVKFLEK